VQYSRLAPSWNLHALRTDSIALKRGGATMVAAFVWVDQTRSNNTAMPWPPPMHMVARA
jgi:hypothetical protein